MDRKELFTNWIAINKLKGVTPSELAENIEGAFYSCLEIDVWKIDDPKEYSDLRNKIILDKSLKKMTINYINSLFHIVSIINFI